MTMTQYISADAKIEQKVFTFDAAHASQDVLGMINKYLSDGWSVGTVIPSSTGSSHVLIIQRVLEPKQGSVKHDDDEEDFFDADESAVLFDDGGNN